MRARSHPLAPHVVTLLLVGAWSAAAASPSVWDNATQAPEQESRALLFRSAMQSGLEFGKNAMAAEIARATGEEIPLGNRRTLSDSAVAAFRSASRIDPSSPEPYYYLALMLIETRLECRDICGFDPKIAAEALEAMDNFEARAPLDPRVGNMMTRRAIYHTRLAGEAKGDAAKHHLESALDAYRSTIERYTSPRLNTEVVFGNMAETLMMLGDVESAIEYYRQALRTRPSTSITLGLAVALDRDERGTEARALLRELGADAIVDWEAVVNEGDIFYVPEGEVEYYRGLINESFGNYEAAAANYSTFIATRAHPQFAARAAHNRDALRAKRP
jgi:tetratricopeptide (TPR) repeat protein